jgi:hypothetical protein
MLPFFKKIRYLFLFPYKLVAVTKQICFYCSVQIICTFKVLSWVIYTLNKIFFFIFHFETRIKCRKRLLKIPGLFIGYSFLYSYIFIHEYKIHPPYSPSFTVSLYSPHSHWYPFLNRTCFYLPIIFWNIVFSIWL